jgi:hypothetical protein
MGFKVQGSRVQGSWVQESGNETQQSVSFDVSVGRRALVLQVPAVVDDGSRGPGNAQADARRRCGAIAGAPTNHDGAGAAVSDRDGGPAAGGVKRGHSPLRVRAVDFDDSDALAGLPSAAAETTAAAPWWFQNCGGAHSNYAVVISVCTRTPTERPRFISPEPRFRGTAVSLER